MLLNRRTLILAGLAVAAVSGCSVESKVEFLTGTATYVAQNSDNPLARVAATASQQIGWRLLVQGDRTKNPLLSPASLCAALALAGLGASGASATGLDELFGMNSEDRAVGISTLRAALADYVPESIDARNPPEKPIINLASRFLICSDVQPTSPFLDAIRKHFDSSAKKVKNSDAQVSLDAWAKKNTAGLIEQSGSGGSQYRAGSAGCLAVRLPLGNAVHIRRHPAHFHYRERRDRGGQGPVGQLLRPGGLRAGLAGCSSFPTTKTSPWMSFSRTRESTC